MDVLITITIIVIGCYILTLILVGGCLFVCSFIHTSYSVHSCFLWCFSKGKILRLKFSAVLNPVSPFDTSFLCAHPLVHAKAASGFINYKANACIILQVLNQRSWLKCWVLMCFWIRNRKEDMERLLQCSSEQTEHVSLLAGFVFFISIAQRGLFFLSISSSYMF